MTDQFSVTSPGNRGSPIICGTNTGQHSEYQKTDNLVAIERYPKLYFERFHHSCLTYNSSSKYKWCVRIKRPALSKREQFQWLSMPTPTATSQSSTSVRQRQRPGSGASRYWVDTRAPTNVPRVRFFRFIHLIEQRNSHSLDFPAGVAGCNSLESADFLLNFSSRNYHLHTTWCSWNTTFE